MMSGMSTVSRSREYISMAVIGAVLAAAVFLVRAYADPIKAFIDRHAFWGLFLYLLLNILDADYTFLNELLARHYGIPGISGAEWRRVDGIKKFGRGGQYGLDHH